MRCAITCALLWPAPASMRATRGDALLHPAAQACCTTYQARRIDVSQRVSDGCVLGASGFPVFCIRGRVVHDSAASTPGCIVRSVAVSARPVRQSARTNRQGAKPNTANEGQVWKAYQSSRWMSPVQLLPISCTAVGRLPGMPHRDSERVSEALPGGARCLSMTRSEPPWRCRAQRG